MKLSYSSSSTYLGCELKFFLEKIENAPHDPDYDDDKYALRYGLAYHQVLEHTKHDHRNFRVELLDAACAEHNLGDQEKYSVYAALTSYYVMHKKSCLKCVATEFRIGDDDITGYVDAILMDSHGNWWICDLKTSGMIQTAMFPRLCRDPQLNLYAYYYREIAGMFELEPSQFQGCRYRVTGKPRHAIKDSESLKDYAKRANPKAFDVEVPVRDMLPEVERENMQRITQVVSKLNKEKLIRNRASCFNYNSPCQYWSHCHPSTYSDSALSVKAYTQEDMTDRTIIPAQNQGIDDMEWLA